MLVAGLVWGCFGDIWAGRPVPGNLLAHGAKIAKIAAVWLLSPEAAFITGEALVVDGGLTAQSHMRGMNDPRPAHLRS